VPGRPLLIQCRIRPFAVARDEHRRLIRALVLGVVTATLAACGSSGTQVDAPSPQGATASACQVLVPLLPRAVAGQESRPVLPPSQYAAAWGDPAIVLRCGVEEPDGLEPTSQLFTIDGIDWFPATGADATTFTTIGRVANVEVVVPRSITPEAAALTDLAAGIKRSIPPSPAP